MFINVVFLFIEVTLGHRKTRFVSTLRWSAELLNGVAAGGSAPRSTSISALTVPSHREPSAVFTRRPCPRCAGGGWRAGGLWELLSSFYLVLSRFHSRELIQLVDFILWFIGLRILHVDIGRSCLIMLGKPVAKRIGQLKKAIREHSSWWWWSRMVTDVW